MSARTIVCGALLGSCVLTMGCGDDGAVGDSGAGDSARDSALPECAFEVGPPEELPEPTIHTPRWAFEPWISKDISDRADTLSFVDGFQSRDIPVGVVVLDSPWETNYNTFIPNPSRYPDFEGLIDELDESGIRTVLWTTQLVNRASFDAEEGGDGYDGPASNFFEGLYCDFYIERGQTYAWWKGTGAAVDFFDEGARQWWHRQQDALLDMGVDGWKLDFGESYIRRSTVQTAEGEKTLQEYSEAYYRDFYAYGQQRAGREFVTMVRPYDQSYDFEGRFFARPEHAPVAWVGDNHRDWEGLSDALDHIFRSAAAGYVVVGSDIGGYLDRDELNLVEVIPFDLEVFQRWTALGALTPFMQLHGRANLEPWAVDDPADETVPIYRYWSKLHSAMVPFFFSLAEEAYASGGVMIHPLGDGPAEWAGDYRFMLGDAFLVAPVLAPGGSRDVALPPGEWFDFFDPAGEALTGEQTIASYDLADRSRIGLFVKRGAIVPLQVIDDSNGLGTLASAGAHTVLVWPGEEETRFVVHDEDEATTTITATVGEVSVSRAVTPILLRVRADATPTTVNLDGDALTDRGARAAFDAADDGWFFEDATRSLWVKLGVRTAAATVAWTSE